VIDARRKPAGSGVEAPEHGEDVFGRPLLRPQRDRPGLRNPLSPRHCLQEQPATRREQIVTQREEASIDLVLQAGGVLLLRAEMLEGPDAHHRVEWAEGIGVDLLPVTEVHLEPAAPARLGLLRRQRQTYAPPASLLNRLEKPTPSTADIEDAVTRREANVVEDIRMLVALGLLQGFRVIAHVQCVRDVGILPQAEPPDLIHVVVSGVNPRRSSHRPSRRVEP